MSFLLIGHGYWGKVWENIISLSHHSLHSIIDPFLYNNNIQSAKIDSVDSVVIASPIDTHFSYAKYCILNNKNLLIEKPGTHTLNDIRKLAALKTTKNIGVGYVLLYCSGIQKIKNSNIKWKTAFFNRSNGSSQRRTDCNVIYDLLCHDIALAYYFFNSIPILLYCQKNDDSIFCILQFDETVCHFYCSRIDTQKLSNCRLVGDDITYVYNDIAKKLQIFKKNTVEEERFNESPLLNQLEHFSTKFIADLPFAVKIHQILLLCSNGLTC